MIIVSMTSYPPRIAGAVMAIRSILDGVVKPDKVVLNLKDPEFPNREKDLPDALLALCNQGLEINWWPRNIRSFAKVVPTLTKYPDDAIVLADDDFKYPSDWLEAILTAHEKFPRDIIASRAHIIPLGRDGSIAPYNNWLQSVHGCPNIANVFPTTGAGTLYPPHSLSEFVCDEDVFLQDCPRADDVWMWAMRVLKGTRVRVLRRPFIQVPVAKAKGVALANYNVEAGGNDIQLDAVLRRFPQIRQKLSLGFSPNVNRKMFRGIIWRVNRNRLQMQFILGIPLWTKIYDLNYEYAWLFVLGIPIWRRKQFYPKLCITQCT